MKAATPVLPGYKFEELRIGKDQNVYFTLPAVAIGDKHQTVLVRYEFDEEDRKRIAQGQSLYLWVITFGEGFQPVRLEIKTAEELVERTAEQVETEGTALPTLDLSQVM
jgi:hypothetical protein